MLQQISSSKLGAQAIPLKNLVSRTGEGHSIQILSVATLQAKKNRLFSTYCINWLIDMLFVITDAKIRGGKPWLCQKFSENAGILQPETLLSDFEVPQVRDLDVWRLLPGLRPGPFMSLASTAPPLLSRNSAAATWPLSAAQCSGVEPQALVPGNPSATVGFGGTMARRPMCRGWRTEMWAAEFYIRSTDKGTMNVLDSTASNCAKQNIFTHNHKHIEQVSWHFVSNKLPPMKRCLLLIV